MWSVAVDPLISYSFYKDVSGTRSGYGSNCGNKDVSLPYKLWAFKYVRHDDLHLLCSTLSVFDDCSSSQDGPASRRVPGTNGSSAEPIPLKRVEVAMHTRSEQFAGSGLRASQHRLYLNKDGQLYDKPHERGTGGDLESSRYAEEK